MDALILADGDLAPRDVIDATWPGWDDDVRLVLAADGGARHARALAVRIDRWIGDGDSVDPADLEALVAAGVPIERTSPDKDESDTELAVRASIRLGADGIVIVGALGGPRVDHAIANIGLLGMAELTGHQATILDGGVRIRSIRAPDDDGLPVRHALTGRVGDVVSLLPAGDGVEGVTTGGLRYPLADEPLPAGPARGLSNLRDATDAWVVVRRGFLLVVESPATL
jgi:thiamine pyrophosphokinase